MNVKVMIMLALFMQSFIVVKADDKCDCKCKESSVLWKYALPVVGGVAAVVAAPVALAAAGFGAGGIAAGSLAAKAMSLTATTGYGAGVVGTLQAAGASGLGVVGNAITGFFGYETAKVLTDSDGVQAFQCQCCQK